MSFSLPNYCTESFGVHWKLIFNKTNTSELRTAELSPKGVSNSEVLLYINLNVEIDFGLKGLSSVAEKSKKILEIQRPGKETATATGKTVVHKKDVTAQKRQV